MFEFWFDPQTSLSKRVLSFVLIAIVTAILYNILPLALNTILMFCGIGIIFLICRYCKLHFAAAHPTGILYRLLTWIPIALLLALIFMQMKNGEILLPGAQGIGFMALTVCLLSPLSLLHKNASASGSE
ncbi:hypothetical protein [Acinetobacter sp. WZC-1]|uniref:hypothetical protein n=1 Tax=Acinetobacter sp. WZC-1 TaxID=3459034 RepID=UPI00403D5D66